MFQSSPCAADSDLHALVAELGLGLPLVKLDVVPPELLDQFLLAADVEPSHSGDHQGSCQQLHYIVPVNKGYETLYLYTIDFDLLFELDDIE